MQNETKRIVDKAWGFAHLLREEGLSYLAYTEQITFLLFLKMAHEIAVCKPRRAPLVPKGWGWDSLTAAKGQALIDQYNSVLEKLSREGGMLGEIFRKPRPEIHNPRTLQRLIVDFVGAETWTSMDADVKGDIYEGLLARSATESPRGAGQYFTPRGLIGAIVDCVQPTPDDTVCDPAAGTGGFLLAAHKFASAHSGRASSARRRLARGFVHGWELVPNTARLCTMNLYLHGVDAGPSPVRGGIDALAEPPDRLFSVVLTNPPFGKKGSIPTGQNGKGTGDGGDEPGGYSRPDLWVATANKQLNFLQHVFTLLEQGGRCAIVVPDNVLFEGGAGEVIRRNLLERCRVHTLLRLPPGIFYAQGVKANVLFFDREEPEHRATMWVYDLRSSKHFTLRQRPIQRSDFDEFVECYRPNELEKRRQTWSEKRPEGRWRRFDCGNLLTSSKVSLELSWLRDEEIHAANRDLPPSGDLAAMIANELRTAWEQFDRVSARLNRRA